MYRKSIVTSISLITLPFFLTFAHNVKVSFCNIKIFIDAHLVKPGSRSSTARRINPFVGILLSKSIKCSNYGCQYFSRISIICYYLVIKFTRCGISVTKSKVINAWIVCFLELHYLDNLAFTPYTCESKNG